MPAIYILLPVHNRKEITRGFIECLKMQTFTDYHLLLIDDGSEDGTAEMVQEIIPSVTVLRGTGDWWWAGSLQQGLDWLKQQEPDDEALVLIINDDLGFAPDYLESAVRVMAGEKGVLMLSRWLSPATGKIEESGVAADLNKLAFNIADSAEQINCLSTRGLFVHWADVRVIGDFHPVLLPHYWSDYEYTIRAFNKGLKCKTSAELVVVPNRETTGLHAISESRFGDYVKRYFSKRSVINPVYKSLFIMLVTPWSHVPFNLLKVWRHALVLMLKQFKKTLKMRLEKLQVKRLVRQCHEDIKVIIGSAATRQDGWISTNYPLLDLTDESTFAALFDAGTISNFYAEHVWEHLSPDDGAKGFRNCFAYLKHGGNLRIAVPDGFHPDADYINQVKPGGYGPGADDHKILYNCKTLSARLEQAGYKVRLLEWFDEQGTFHQENWSADGGHVMRSTRFDPRNKVNPTAYTSLIIDAIKP